MIGKGMLLGVLVVSVKEAEKAMQAGAVRQGLSVTASFLSAVP